MRRHTPLGVLGPAAAAVVLAGARPLGAQAPAERAALDSIRAATDAVADSAALIRLEGERIAVARAHRDSAALHMELGFIAFRLGALTGAERRYEDAASEFQWAADLQPRWPLAWYWLGLAELKTGENRIIPLENIRQIIGMDYLSVAARDFARAVQVDSSFWPAVVDLATTALRQRIAPQLGVAQSVLRQVAGGPAGRVPAVQLLRGRVERRLQEPDSALAAFRAYVALGGDTALGDLEIARSQAILGRVDSCRIWYARALARPPDDSTRQSLRRDLRWIATPSELAAFDRAPADSVGPLVERFWAARDAADGRRPGARLAEQFRRYEYAVQHFALPSRHRKVAFAFVYNDTTQDEFDDRGLVYLRHGEPSERVRYVSPMFEANETWRYRLGPPEGDLVLHFAPVSGVADWRLLESLRAVCQPRAFEPLLRSNLVLGRTPTDVRIALGDRSDDVARCVQSRAGMSDLYDRLARVGTTTSENLWADERAASRAMVHEAVTTDSYVHHYAESLEPVVSWFVVANEAMRPELHLVFAVPGTRLHPVAAPDGALAYPLELRLVVSDSASGAPLAELDTVRVFRSGERLGSGAYLTEQLALAVPPGRHRYAFVISEPNDSLSGDAVTHRELEVPPVAGGFAASDLVLGREGSGLIWHRRSGDVWLNPLLRYPRDGAATLYYEIYGLPAGTAVATRVRIAPAGGRSLFRRLFGGGGGTELAYNTVTDTPGRAVVRQRMDLRGLAAGRYTLQVELRTPEATAPLVRRGVLDVVDRTPS